MGASLLFGTMGDSLSRAWSGQGASSTGGAVYSSVITEANAERLANALCRFVLRCILLIEGHMRPMIIWGALPVPFLTCPYVLQSTGCAALP